MAVKHEHLGSEPDGSEHGEGEPVESEPVESGPGPEESEPAERVPDESGPNEIEEDNEELVGPRGRQPSDILDYFLRSPTSTLYHPFPDFRSTSSIRRGNEASGSQSQTYGDNTSHQDSEEGRVATEGELAPQLDERMHIQASSGQLRKSNEPGLRARQHVNPQEPGSIHPGENLRGGGRMRNKLSRLGRKIKMQASRGEFY